LNVNRISRNLDQPKTINECIGATENLECALTDLFKLYRVFSNMATLKPLNSVFSRNSQSDLFNSNRKIHY
jgi:hypothetical protein